MSDFVPSPGLPSLALTMALPQPPVPQTATCYRHPDREAGRRCTRCGKWACTDCLVQASVGSHCLDCAKAERPDVATRARYWNARQPTLVTYVLMALNVAVFVWLVAPGPVGARQRPHGRRRARSSSA